MITKTLIGFAAISQLLCSAEQMPSLNGAGAVSYLKEVGLYASLAEAVSAMALLSKVPVVMA